MTLPNPSMSASTLRTVYLGTPGAMSKLVVPNAGVAFPLSRGGTSAKLLSGGTSKVSQTRTRRTYSLSWGDRTLDDLDPILGFYSGLRGEGPFCLVDPAWRNLMSHSRSTFGKQLQAISGWSAPVSSSISYDAAFVMAGYAGPTNNSGVLKWTSPANGAYLFEGTQAVAGTGVPDVDSITRAGTAIPYLADQAHTLSVAVMTYSGTASLRIVAFGLPAAGAALTGATRVNGATAAVGAGAPSLLSVSVPVGTAGFSAAATPYLCMGIQVTAAGAGNVAVAAAMQQIGVSTPGAWVQGLGVPRVLVLDDNPAGVTIWDRQTQSLTLAEI